MMIFVPTMSAGIRSGVNCTRENFTFTASASVRTNFAIGACMVWQAAGSWKRSEGALRLFFLQLVPNLAWSLLFSRLHQPQLALVDIAVVLAMAVLMVREFHRLSWVAAVLQYPYVVWLAFATYLNAWVVFAN